MRRASCKSCAAMRLVCSVKKLSLNYTGLHKGVGMNGQSCIQGYISFVYSGISLCYNNANELGRAHMFFDKQ